MIILDSPIETSEKNPTIIIRIALLGAIFYSNPKSFFT